MELNLEREHINCYSPVLESEVCGEETLEAIVPDACPDIARIVDAGGSVCLTGKQVRDGVAVVSGTVLGWVLYQPEGGQDLCRMEVKLPFSMQTEASQLHTQTQITASPRLRSMDARALNPRKILVRADLAVVLQAYDPEELTLCRAIRCDAAEGVQQRTVQHTVYLTAAVQEKEFTFYDEIHLSAGPAGKAQVLCIRADAQCEESRIIGSKLIFKGEAAVQVRYLVGSELCSMRCSIPFSQIMELDGVGEGADCDLSVCLTDVEWVQAGEDGRTLNVTLELLGQAVVRDNVPITVLQDCYSTACKLSVHQEHYTVEQLLDHSVRPQSVRELLETDGPVKSVIDARVNVFGMERLRQESGERVSAQLRISVLYLDERDELQMLNCPMTVSGSLELPANGACRCSCHCPGEVFSVPAAGGVEVRFTTEFRCLVTGKRSVPVVTGVAPEQSGEEVRGRQPSVVLRAAVLGEDLWDIAKSCSTTQECIRKANALDEGEPLPVGQMLLIPGMR